MAGCVVLWGLAVSADGSVEYIYTLPSQGKLFAFADGGYVGCGRDRRRAPARAIEVHPYLIVVWGPGSNTVAVRNYIAVLITAVLPALWLYRCIRHRTKPGHCPGCGYNLKGTIEAGRMSGVREEVEPRRGQ